MTAPTREEIRLAVIRTWSQRRLEGVLEDALGWELGTAAACELWDFPDEDDAPAPDRMLDAAIDPILADVKERAMEAVATVLEAFAKDHPDLSRKRPVSGAR